MASTCQTSTQDNEIIAANAASPTIRPVARAGSAGFCSRDHFVAAPVLVKQKRGWTRAGIARAMCRVCDDCRADTHSPLPGLPDFGDA